MIKTSQSFSQSVWPSSSGLGDLEFNNSTAKLKSAVHSGILVRNKLKYIHFDFGFQFKCKTNLTLCGEPTKAEGVKIKTTLDGDS